MDKKDIRIISPDDECAAKPINESMLNERERRVLELLQRAFPGTTFYQCQNLNMLAGRAFCEDYIAPLSKSTGICGYKGLELIEQAKQSKDISHN